MNIFLLKQYTDQKILDKRVYNKKKQIKSLIKNNIEKTQKYNKGASFALNSKTSLKKK